MGTVGGDAAFLNLRKQLTELAPGTENAGKPGLRAAGTEAAPLPTRIQDRIGREAAYEASKKEIEKWQGIIQKNRKADQLDFSTTTFGESASAVVSSAALVSQFKPQTDMEQEIAKILQDSALNEKKQMELEDLEMNKLSPEEIAAKRQELVRLRSLAFYAEQKAKKVAKIKSKTYRKIHKKDAMRKAAKEGSGEMSLEELNELDPEAAREKAEKLHTDRIKERMTLKHKSTGKWARKMLSRGDRDDETRQALMDQLNQSQTLTRKIAGLESDEDSDALNESDTEDALASSRQRLADLEDQIGLDLEKAVPKKGLYAMKFMQRGLEKQMKESREMLAEARRELEEEGVGYDSDEDDAPKIVKKKIVPVKAGVGRMVFGGEEEELDGGGDDDGEEDGEDVDGGNQISSAQFNVKMAKPISIGKGGESFAVSKSKDSTFSAKISNAVFGDDPTASKPTKKGKASKQVPVVESTPDISAPAPSKLSKQSANKTKDDDESNPWLTVTATTKKSTKAGKDTHTDKALDKMNKVKQLQKASETIADLDVTLNLDGVRKLEV
ncbi:U3 small nucleolar RNA-associated protein 14 A, partial [Rhizoclosmatium hyalinum]